MPVTPLTPNYNLAPIQVKELVEGFSLSLNEDGQSGTRRFIDATATTQGTEVALPSLGDAWDDNYPNLLLTNIRIAYINNNDLCPFVYECTYSARPDSTSTFADEEDLPTSISSGVEFISLQTKSGSWTWESDGTKLADTSAIFKTTSVTNISMRRTIKDLKEFATGSIALNGCLNDLPWFGFARGTVMYMGFDAEETRTPHLNSRRWNITLKFSVRQVIAYDNGTEGWNYILREDTGKFDSPIVGTPGTYLYEYTDFAVLNTLSQIDTDYTIVNPLQYIGPVASATW